MKKEKQSEIFHDALQFLDDEMIEDVEKLRGGVAVKKKTIRSWRKWTALAASVCVLVVAAGAWSSLDQDDIRFNEMASDIETEMQENSDVNESYKENFGMQEGAPGTAGSLTDVVNPEGLDEVELGAKNDFGNYITIKYQIKNIDSEKKRTVSEEDYAVMDKFIEAYKKGDSSLVDYDVAWENVEKEADGHLYFELSDGSTIHFVLLGNGTICYYEIPSVWIDIDKNVYDEVLDVLREE